MATRGREWGQGELDEDSQKVQTSSVRYICTRDIMYNTINIIITAICYIWKLFREQIVRVLIPRKKVSL